MEWKDSNEYVEVINAEELLTALNNKESYIIVKEEYKKEFLENTELPFTEKELMGLQLGSHGGAAIGGGIIFAIINFFSKGSKQQKKIDSKMRNYILKGWKDNELLLYLRQLDY
ncbi:hypothetical protein BN1058_01449 [Paraliobacillus sp. PM-2]|uniref:hypothetical protein n=1 Tax=Paraliobacillus sp. PM-2 TaxID=1462524 RepID=UPI00061BD0E2|nr:hypothetical protein [Paraliobacillus sp. PM-2]CQR47158.1 hypothetical protein BN1058_01449 [Paraliobacillus sp. PM-2]